MRRRLLLLIAAVLAVGLLLISLYRSGRFGFARVRNATSFPREFLRYQFTSSSPERSTEGAALFRRHCSACHGLEQAEAALLARQGFAKFGDLAMASFIRDGPAPEDMPTFRNRMRDRQTFDLLAYLRSLQDLAPTAPQNRPPVLDGAYSYVALHGAIRIYEIGQEHRIVKQIRVPGMIEPRGIVASPKTGLLHVSFDGSDREDEIGELVCLDLATGEIRWSRKYSPGVDSMALSPDGTTIFMPGGEADLSPDGGQWLILDAVSGDERGRVVFGTSPHNTVVGPAGNVVYLAGARSNYLGVLDTATNSIVGKIGPFGAGVRPFTLTSDGKYALVNVNALVGFEVADLASRKVIHRVQVDGAPLEERHLNEAPTHGVAVSPDETEAWICDVWNGFVHIFDISGLPDQPRHIESIEVRRPLLLPTWINFSLDGRYVHVANGAIIDAKSRQIVQWIADSRYYLEVRFRQGKPMAAFPRYGVGYAHPVWWSRQEESH